MANQEILVNKGCNIFMRKEKNRYERKGYGLFFAFLIASAFFFGVPVLGRTYWPALLRFKEDFGLTYC
jgi:hypothetical protein